ncbi:MarR family winged helix-turn-helix transcriptional regulator [Desulfonema magnum]|uniref:Transcriptional regulator, MarR family n=1 Tax=Desulfonema magnum TaxID=45655 RepID=A0A975BNT7_9BACT|nr:helix-turn-helix domain-containing protein [Desulfonema magnum]QTA89119.1 Transcriptional regulator, MarR family [Desulfonema magnum]
METKEDLIKVIIRQLLRVLNKYSRVEELPIRVDEDVEITTREIHTIQAIGENEHINITGVAAHFGVTKSAASQIVRKLADKGFVKKEYAAYSNKELQLSLTKLGWLAFHAHDRFHGKDMGRIIERLSVFSLSQIATISVLLDVIENVMNERLSQK